MGYVKLRKLLCKLPGGVSVAAQKAGIPINRLYNLTAKNISYEEEPKYFTAEERSNIMEFVLKDAGYSEKEVFEFYEDNFFKGIPESSFRRRR